MVDLVPKVDPKKFAKDFRDFLLKTNILSLALGVVIGAAVGEVVNSMVKDVLGSIFDVIVPQAGWDALNVTVWRFKFRFGNLASVLLKFVIVAGVVFMITRAFIKGVPPPPTKTCPACKEGINPEATLCKFCCTAQPPIEAPKPAA